MSQLARKTIPIWKSPRGWVLKNQSMAIRLIIMGGALGFTLFISVIPSLLRLPPVLLYLAPLAAIGFVFGIGIVLFLMRYPGWGIVAIIVACISVPFTLNVGGQSGLNAAVLALALMLGLWFIEMWKRRNIMLHRTRVTVLMLVFIIVAIVAFLVGLQPWKPNAPTAPIGAQIAGLLIFIFSVGAFLLIAHQVNEVKWIERMTWLFLAFVTLVSIGRIEPQIGRYLLPIIVVRATTNSVFWLWGLALSFSMALFNKKLKLFWRVVLLGCFLLMLYARVVVGESWTSGWLPGLVAVGIILWIGAPKLGFIATILAGIFTIFRFQTVYNVLMVGDNVYSLSTRLAAWQILIQIIKINPFLGLGPANYYYNTPLFSILGWNVQFNSHNNYVDIMAQTGLIGLAIYIWIFIELALLGWRLKERVPEGFPRAYVYAVMGGVFGSLAAGMLGDWVIPFYYNVGMEGFRASMLGWMFLGGLVALERIYPSTEESPPKTPLISFQNLKT